MQLRHGCQNPACRTTTCISCRKRFSAVPVRRPTPLTARAQAFFLASEPDAEARLCPYAVHRIPEFYQEERIEDPAKIGERQEKKDPKSFLQLLFDTMAVRVFEHSAIDTTSSSSSTVRQSHSEPNPGVTLSCETLMVLKKLALENTVCIVGIYPSVDRF